jgi:hypothetical protein
VLLDVKRRLADFIAAVGELSADEAAAPRHDVGLLFRSVENKYLQSDPDELLQGAWIVTDIKQSESELQAAFNALDARRVHFAILGDTEQDVWLLTRRPEDRPFLIQLFAVSESKRFVFDRGQAG